MKHERILSFQKKIEAKSPLADMGCFLVFMGLFTLSVMWRVDYDSHYFVQIMRDWVIEEEFPAPDAYMYKNFGDIASEEEFWQYLSGPFVGNMFPEEGTEFFYGTAVIGSIRLRQIRVEDSGEAGCYVPEMMKADFGKECYLELNDNNVAKQKFGNTTALANVRDASDPYHKHFVHAFEYDEEAKAKVTLYEAWRNTYPSKGGYIAVMPSNMTHSKASEFVQQLKSNGWIDGASRAVIIEFAAYNKQTMIFVQTKLFVEFFTTGGAFTYPQFAVCKLATVGTETHLYHQRVALGFRIAVFVFVIGLIIQEFRELAQEGISGYFTSLWNYLDLLNYGVFIVQMIYFISYYVFQDQVIKEINGSDNEKFIDIAYLSQLYNYVDYIAAMNMLFSTLKIFQYLEANKGMATIIYTLGRTANAAVPLLIFLLTFVCSFSIAIYIGFNTIDYNLRSLRHTFVTLLKASFGIESGEWESKIMISDRTIGTLIVAAFRLIVGFFLISMVVTIVDVAYNEMKKTIDEDFNNDVLVASLRIKLNQFYRFLTAYFPWLPEAQKTAIPFSQVVKAEQDKKKFYRWTTDDRLALIEKSIKRERRIVEKIRVDVEEEKGILRRASRPSGDLEVLAKIAMNSIEEGSPTKANRRKSSIR